MTDDQLVQRVKDGDVQAFEELVLRYQKSIYFFVLRILKHPMEAEDTVQKIFLLAYQNIKSFRSESTFKTWLYRIGVNQCNNYFRQIKNKEFTSIDELPVADLTVNQEGDVAEKETLESLRKAVNRLPNKQRMVVTLRIYQELSFEEIGTALTIGTNSAKVNFHHAMANIKKWIKI